MTACFFFLLRLQRERTFLFRFPSPKTPYMSSPFCAQRARVFGSPSGIPVVTFPTASGVGVADNALTFIGLSGLFGRREPFFFHPLASRDLSQSGFPQVYVAL